MSLTDAQRRVLEAVATLESYGLGARSSQIGEEVWGSARGSSSNPHTRTAGKVLGALAKRELPLVHRDRHAEWHTTIAGRAVIASAE